MKIAVTASPEMEHPAKRLMKALSSAGLECYGLKFHDGWMDERRSRLDDSLSRASHLLCVVDAAAAASGWFAFLAGWTHGGNRPLALYRLDPSWKPRAWVGDVPVLDGEDEAVAFYLSQLDEWTFQERRRQARANLLELGISWHTDSLAQCVRDGDTRAVEFFLDSGFRPGVRDKHGVPLLSLAARSRHLNVAELLLDRGADVNARSDDRGYTALMDAAQLGDAGLLSMLLSRGSDPDLASKDGQTALVIVVGRNDLAMAGTLLEAGADPDLADKLGLSARKYASLFHNREMMDLISRTRPGP